MSNFKLSVVTPTGTVLEEAVLEVTMPGAQGELGVYPNHQPAMIMLGGGLLSYQAMSEVGQILVRGGVAEIGPESVLVLTDYAKEVTEATAEEATSLLAEIDEIQSRSDSILDDDTLRQIQTKQGYADAVRAVTSK